MAFQWCPNFDLVAMFRALSDDLTAEAYEFMAAAEALLLGGEDGLEHGDGEEEGGEEEEVRGCEINDGGADPMREACEGCHRAMRLGPWSCPPTHPPPSARSPWRLPQRRR